MEIGDASIATKLLVSIVKSGWFPTLSLKVMNQLCPKLTEVGTLLTLTLFMVGKTSKLAFTSSALASKLRLAVTLPSNSSVNDPLKVADAAVVRLCTSTAFLMEQGGGSEPNGYVVLR